MGQVNLERNSFVRGLITEATALTFPENASIDEDNFILNRDGSRQRRLGMDYENLATLVDTNKTPLVFDSQAVQAFRWTNINNDATLSFGVIQVGNDLWFVDLFADALSGNLKNGGVPFTLDTATIGYTISGNERLDFTSINGHLIIVGRDILNPLYVGYDVDNDDFFLRTINIEVRDIWGVFDTLAVDERPKTLSDTHKYNLLNQGWKADKITAVFGSKGQDPVLLKDRYPIAYNSDGTVRVYGGPGPNSLRAEAAEIISQYGTDGNLAVPDGGANSFPSNADIISIGKKADGTFDATLIDGSFLGSTPAPKGKFILVAFDRGASRITESDVSGLLADKDSGNISVVASFANRIFYSGVDSTVVDPTEVSPNYTGTVFFTQVAENISQIGRCYQDADPSSEDISDLIPTDGGTIKISGASNILKLVPTTSSLVVFAENGVWEITGPDGVFKATDFSISKVSNVGVTSGGSVVDAEGNILYWSDGGIYQLVADQISGKLNAKNITEGTIQTLYNLIPSVGAANVTSIFDPASRQVKWLYNDTDSYDGVTLKYKYNKELILDTVLGSFSTNTIGDITTDSPFVAGYLVTQNFNTVDDVQSVVVNGVQVQVNGVDVVVTQGVRSRGVSQTKYLTFRPNEIGSNYGFTFSHFNQAGFLDWKTADSVGIDAPAFVIAGFELFQDSQRDKQVTYLTSHFTRTETGFTDTGGGQLDAVNPSGCLVQVQWDFANSAAGGKFGTQFQVYRLNRLFIPTGTEDSLDYGTSVITTKSKLRGSGKAISLRFDSEPGKDVILLGWAMNVEGKSNV